MAKPTMDMRISAASAVIVQRVPAASADWFQEWQREVTSAVEGFAGYRSTNVYPPSGEQGGDWVVVVNFTDEESLRAWLASPVRAEWVKKLQERMGDFDLRVVPGGFASWFTGCVQAPGDSPPPGWKMVLVVLLGLYPTVMVLTLFPGPYTQPLGLAMAMLIGNALSVCILQWGVMPMLNRVCGPWIKADPARRPLLTLGGLVGIFGVLAGLVLLFRQVTG